MMNKKLNEMMDRQIKMGQSKYLFSFIVLMFLLMINMNSVVAEANWTIYDSPEINGNAVCGDDVSINYWCTLTPRSHEGGEAGDTIGGGTCESWDGNGWVFSSAIHTKANCYNTIDDCPIGCDCVDGSNFFNNPTHETYVIGYSSGAPDYQTIMNLTATQFCIEEGFTGFVTYATQDNGVDVRTWYTGTDWSTTGGGANNKIINLECTSAYSCSGQISCSDYLACPTDLGCTQINSCEGNVTSETSPTQNSNPIGGVNETELNASARAFCQNSTLVGGDYDDFESYTFESNGVASYSYYEFDEWITSTGINNFKITELNCTTKVNIDCSSQGTEQSCNNYETEGCEWNPPTVPSQVNDIFGFSDKIWAATNEGLYVFDSSYWVVYNVSNSGLPSNIVSSVYFDEESTNLWIGTNEGLVKKNGEIWQTYNTSNSELNNNNVLSLVVSDSVLFIGTEDGLSVMEDNLWKAHNSSTGFDFGQVNSLTSAEDGAWAATNNGIVFIPTISGTLTNFDNIKIKRTDPLEFENNNLNCKYRAECSFSSGNFYHPFPEDGIKCVSNVGGGLRLSSYTDCNSMEDCITKSMNYTTYDEDMTCDRSSGVIDLIPMPSLKNNKFYSKYASVGETEVEPIEISLGDYDIRRPSHLAAPTISGGVMYGETSSEIDRVKGKIINKFFTTDHYEGNIPSGVFKVDEFKEDSFLLR